MKLTKNLEKEFKKLDFEMQVHVTMIMGISNEIAKLSNIKLDKKKLIVYAIFHDFKNKEKDHARLSAEYAKNYLKKEKHSNKLIEEVYEVILNHSIKPKVKDFTIACFYDADILCRFYPLGVMRAWNNIRSDPKRNWKKLFKAVSDEKNLNNYLKKMEHKLQLSASRKILKSKEEEYIYSHKLLRGLI